MRLEPGMLIKTNYSGPYRIVSVMRPVDKPFVHLLCSRPDRANDHYYLNYWREDTLQSIQKTYCGHKTELAPDWIIILENDKPVQMTLF